MNIGNDLKNKYVEEQRKSDGVSTFIVEKVPSLSGATNTKMAMELYFAEQAGLSLRQVKIVMNNGAIKTESGALYYFCGHIKSETKIGGVGGLFKKAISAGLTNESLVKPVYTGTGEIVLEPSFKHYILIELSNEEIIVDKGLFFCCSNKIEIASSMQKNVSSTLLGGEGMFQLSLKGSGIVVLELNVPESEIVKYDLKGGMELKVDGSFVIARTSNIKFSVTKSDKSFINSAINGEGLLNTFTGEGTVWLAPTEPIYKKMMYQGLPTNNNNMNNK